jgi:DNA-binding NtrC family response regulator
MLSMAPARSPVSATAPGVLVDGLAATLLRLEEETARALRYERALAVAVVDLGGVPAGDHARIAAALGGSLRGCDVVGWDGGAEAIVLLPETADSARVPAARIARALAALAPAARLGFARCPEDAADAATLLAGAREAVRAAAPLTVAGVPDAVQRWRLADREVAAVDPAMKRLFALIERLAAGDLAVLVHGETGAGKEIVAGALHAWSPRRAARLVAINCAALPEPLLESELFGHERGAFSGAVAARAGHLEVASGGTVFLDEISECSPAAQAKVLRALDTKRVTRLGSTVERAVDVRLVAATHRPLQAEVAAGRFREDLFFRLGAATVVVPPLRERRLDLPLLARLFLAEARARVGRPPLTLAPRALGRLLAHRWPGNVRELKNVMDYLAVTVDGGRVEAEHLPDPIGTGAPGPHAPGQHAPGQPAPGPHAPGQHAPARGARVFQNLYEEIRALERTRILEALAETGGVRNEAAALLGVPLRTFVTKLRELGVDAPPAPRGKARP